MFFVAAPLAQALPYYHFSEAYTDTRVEMGYINRARQYPLGYGNYGPQEACQRVSDQQVKCPVWEKYQVSVGQYLWRDVTCVDWMMGGYKPPAYNVDTYLLTVSCAIGPQYYQGPR